LLENPSCSLWFGNCGFIKNHIPSIAIGFSEDSIDFECMTMVATLRKFLISHIGVSFSILPLPFLALLKIHTLGDGNPFPSTRTTGRCAGARSGSPSAALFAATQVLSIDKRAAVLLN
jgi:hypothetical protein